MKVIIGLGNPGKTYQQTRHNVGFLVLDELAQRSGAAFVQKAKFKAEIAEIQLDNETVLLVKPTTFYNLVGESARSICNFYHLTSQDVLVIHDDLSLPWGTIRSRHGGSDAGNNGVKSLNHLLGENYSRVRIGIWTDGRPQVDATDYVLHKFAASDLQAIREKATDITEDIVALFARQGLAAATYKFVDG